MKKAKLIKTKEKEVKIEENESYSIKELLKIVLIVVLVFGMFYVITYFVASNKKEEQDLRTDTGVIDSEKMTLNNLLNRKENEYYVLATKEYNNTKTNFTELYDKYIKDYESKNDKLVLYRVNLNDALNKKYMSKELNITNEIDKLQLNDDVLFKIKDHKIEEYFVGSSKIVEKLSNL